MHEVPAIAFLEVARYLRHAPHHSRTVQAYLARARSHQGGVAIGYTSRSVDGLGRKYAVGPSAQALPREARRLLFGADRWEVDLRGCFYELVRRCLQQVELHVVLPGIAAMRQCLVGHLARACPAEAAAGHAKRITQHALNNGGVEAFRALRRLVPFAPQAVGDLLLTVGQAASAGRCITGRATWLHA